LALTSSNQDDDSQDQIGSTASTPSGIATPQPDPSDKRLPGIMHSFFAQVRAGSGSASNPNSQRSPLLSCVVSARRESRVHALFGGETEASCDTASLSGSITVLERGQGSDTVPPALSAERSDLQKIEESLGPSDTKSLPPSPCSLAQKETEEAENGVRVVDRGMGYICRALKSLILSKNSLKARHHTSQPISSISCDSVLASHFSNPCFSCSLALSASYGLLPSSNSSGKLAKLTISAARVSRTKNTPPLTPRAMSNETTQLEKRSGLSIESSPIRSHPDSTRSNEHPAGASNESFPSRPAAVTEGQGPPVGLVKGKLSVKISEGRGLRPSYDPYVVCVFEWNEYISKGAQTGAAHEFDTRTAKNDTLGSMPIQRTNGDSGRPMAIPMKSRQSSNNSQLDNHEHRGLTQVTDPQWNHDAVLCVRLSSLIY
jgi:protein-serine/threonine kinase